MSFHRSSNDIRPSDWICLECTTNSHSNRKICFQCPTTYEENLKKERSGSFFVGSNVSDTLIIRNLPNRKVEDSEMIKLLSKNQMQVKKVFFETRGNYCFIQYESERLAKEMMDYIMKNGLKIDGNHSLMPAYSAISMNKVLELDYPSRVRFTYQGCPKNKDDWVNKTAQARQLAMNALGSGQMCNSIIQNHHNVPNIDGASHNLSVGRTIQTPFGTNLVYERPNPRTFQKSYGNEPYYLDTKTGFRYDPSSTYFFDPTEHIWKMWVDKYFTYIPVEGGDQSLKKRLLEETKRLPNFEPSFFASNVYPSPKTPKEKVKENAIKIKEKIKSDIISTVSVPIKKEIEKPKKIPMSLKNAHQIRINIGSALNTPSTQNISKKDNPFQNGDDDEDMDIDEVRPYKIKQKDDSKKWLLKNRNSYTYDSRKVVPVSTEIPTQSISSKVIDKNTSDEDLDRNIDNGKYDFLLPEFFQYIRTNMVVKSLEEIEANNFYKDPMVVNWSEFHCNLCVLEFNSKNELIEHIIEDKVHRNNIDNIGID
ncbi:Zinc finger, RanBP2-type domain and Nucleotide-binding, alpha-beta plait domain-containing protein [Strongyloides ratti]|uniref:Zinc finger, RanBP2-type domain and Nucleotide-binding, alpha-beta plait domain-containing protein n=1 Tax=Strongyloides ratti TaxID=34506 RepID=A0A090LE15_STRRB|nr:Zinc finger, RanBP2-type domain and Nucleotide-binding, alpha-beta plait domain-containing protein [Strongyloides ratti]CEF68036.1 Zinc finger, RanBP2-type domain and Nucleotide-binding, alpha-beta plait domain-containing protein [Strongyloides ratti]